jgi:hypothetical protein
VLVLLVLAQQGWRLHIRRHPRPSGAALVESLLRQSGVDCPLVPLLSCVRARQARPLHLAPLLH